ncbi:MAG TPA: CRISPR-associated endonuclease Cas6 [Saprospiraceae bacterium]|nr:CRISPR-associated endonuclease Cas6 [Saprospiraceae bacterium]
MKKYDLLQSGIDLSEMGMQRIRYLHIVFDRNIQSYDIPKFRAAVIEKSNRESNLFHNHLDDHTFLYRYPLIQYKVKDRKASMLCLNEATDDIHYLLRERDFDFRIGGEVQTYQIEEVRLKYEIIQIWNRSFRYNIHHWMALNQENFRLYQAMSSLADKMQFLEDMLTRHITLFMEAMEAPAAEPLKVGITEIIGEKYIEYKGVFHLTFSLNFTCNLSIPNYVGLGKGVSVGFGIVKRLGDEARTKEYRQRGRKILLSLLWLVMIMFSSAPLAGQGDAWYVREVARQMGGETEVRMEGGRADVVTGEYAIEVEFARLWKQSIGQSLWYALQLNKKPGIVLVMRSLDDRKYGLMLQSALDYAGLSEKVAVWFYPEDFGGTLSSENTADMIPLLHNVDADCPYWLNTGTGVRHNRDCSNFANTKNGRCAEKDDGRECGKCGG